MIIGAVLIALGGRRKTIITNVVQVSNVPGHQSYDVDTGDRSAGNRRIAQTRQVDYVDVTPEKSIERTRRPAPAGSIESQLNSEKTFQVIENELNQKSINILRAAKSDGYEVDFQRGRNWIIVKMGDEVIYLYSNEEIESFGNERRYAG